LTRLQRFLENTGTRGWIQLALVVVALGLVVAHSLTSGLWSFTLPALLVSLAATYILRNVLVENVRTVQPIMSGLAIVAIVASILFRGSAFSDSWWFNVLIVVSVGSYFGAYFWLLSDPRIVVER
jgi:hypothetical protein